MQDEVADPAAYDRVVDRGHVPLTEAADMIITHLRAMEPAAARAAVGGCEPSGS